MRVGAAQHRAVQHARQHEVVDIVALTAQEASVLLAHPAPETNIRVVRRDGHDAATSSVSVIRGWAAAQRIARTMFSYPVQRHRLPEIASRISASDGSGLASRSQRAVNIIPGVQKPHCKPCSVMNPCWMGSSSPPCSKPSTVKTSCPLAIAANIVQLFTGVPSIWTTQTPQLEVSQPQCVPVRPSSSRRKCTSNSLGSISRMYCSPFTFIVTCMITPPVHGNGQWLYAVPV